MLRRVWGISDGCVTRGEDALGVISTQASREACRHCPMTAAARSASAPAASPATQGFVVVAPPLGPPLLFALHSPSRAAAVAAAARGGRSASEPQQVVASSARAQAAGGGEAECHSRLHAAWSVLCHCWGAHDGLCTPWPQPGGPSTAAACRQRGTRPGLPASCVNSLRRHCLGNLEEESEEWGGNRLWSVSHVQLS